MGRADSGAQETGRPAMPAVKALLFDMFGTILDWRTSVARETRRILEPRGHALDWLAFADAWRNEYGPSMAAVSAGGRPFVKLDVLHRENLEKILPRFGVGGLDVTTVDDINRSWHRLDAWPDVREGFARLRTKHLLAPLSNGNISLMVDIARRNGIAFDAILGAEVARAYKPQPEAYQRSCAALDLAPGECMMCAAHADDLVAAAATGMRTAFIRRADEFGPGKGGALPHEPVDLFVDSAIELAEKLGT
jgi:2-haloacid dehalogenase